MASNEEVANTDNPKWEVDKENIKPLKHGRKATVLSAALDDTMQSTLNQQKQQFEDALRTYEGDDPLEIWYEYALWIEQNFPKGGKEGNLYTLIKNCFKVLRENDKTELYKNDKRYLDLWIKYGRITGNCIKIFEVLFDEGYCRKLALFYEEYCWELEKMSCYKKAELIYQKGFENEAMPLDALKEAHKCFQDRVARKTIQGSKETDEEIAQSRKVFSALKTHGTKHKVKLERNANQIKGGPGSFASGGGMNAAAPVFQIFSDENATPVVEKKPKSSRGEIPIGNAYSKENIQNPSQWNKSKAPQKNVSVISVEDVGLTVKQNFNIHRDEASGQPIINKLPPKSDSVLTSRKVIVEEGFEEDIMFIPEPFDPSVKVYYPKHLVYSGTEEYSLEQIRAAEYARKDKEKEDLKAMVKEEISGELESYKQMIKQLQDQISVLQTNTKIISTKQDESKHQESQQNISLAPPNISRQAPNKSIGGANNTTLNALKSRKANKSNVYEDSWLAINNTVNFSVNDPAGKSVMLDEPEKILSHEMSSAKIADSTAGLLSSKPPELSMVENFSFRENPPSPTINTKYAMNQVGDIWSMSLGGIKSESVSQPSESSENFELSNPSSFADKQPEKTPFTIFSDEQPKSPKKSTSGFSIFSDGEPKTAAKAKPTFSIFSDEPKNAETSNNEQQLTNEPEVCSNENLPPADYVVKKEKRTLAGILQPSIDIPIMIEDEDVACEKKPTKEACKNSPATPAMDTDFDMLPIVDREDMTIRLPRSNETFFNHAHVASTPGPWASNIPQAMPDGDDYTMAFSKFSQMKELSKDSENGNSGDLVPPPVQKHLSPIAEVSRERTSSSSSGTSTFGHEYTFEGSTTTQSTAIFKTQNLSVQCAEMSLEPGMAFSTYGSNLTKSGYLADKSKGESILKENKRKSIFQTVRPKKDTFDPSKLAANLLAEDEEELDIGYNLNKHGFSKYQLHDSTSTTKQTGDRLQGLEVPIDPFCDKLKSRIFESLTQKVEQRPGYHQMNTKLPSIRQSMQITLASEHYQVKKLKGEGAYAQIYQATTIDPMNVTAFPCDSDDDNDQENEENQMIFKVEKPACQWEFYMCHELRERLKQNNASESVLDSFARINRGYFFNNGSILVTQYHKYGTLLDLQNNYKSMSKSIEEVIVIYLTLQMIKILEQLHKCEIIHADVKPDNFLMISLPTVNKDASTIEGKLKDISCMKLIDFGGSIDMRKLPLNTTFVEKVNTDQFQCCEMQDGRPWTYQTDFFGVAASVHCLLWGTYMKVVKINGKWELQGSAFKRYWQTDMWKEFFNTCLNIPNCENLPNFSKLTSLLIKGFENCYDEVKFTNLRNSLHSMLKK